MVWCPKKTCCSSSYLSVKESKVASSASSWALKAAKAADKEACKAFFDLDCAFSMKSCWLRPCAYPQHVWRSWGILITSKHVRSPKKKENWCPIPWPIKQIAENSKYITWCQHIIPLLGLQNERNSFPVQRGIGCFGARNEIAVQEPRRDSQHAWLKSKYILNSPRKTFIS